MKINCTYCGIEFNKRPSDIKKQKTNLHFCSMGCKKEYTLEHSYLDRICKICGKEFRAYRHQVEKRGKGECCSLSCAGKSQKRITHIRTCEICKSEFKARKDQINLGKARFCSNKCFGAYSSKTTKGVPRYKHIEKTCKICGEKFTVTKFHKKREICSKKCRAYNGYKHNKYYNTSIERKIKAWLTENKIPFNFQKKIKNIAFPDFFIEPNICIFADGDYWHNYPEGTDKDRRQDRLLKQEGYLPLRFWERDINNNFENVASVIKQTIIT